MKASVEAATCFIEASQKLHFMDASMEVVEASAGRLENNHEKRTFHAPGHFHGSRDHHFHGNFQSLLPWKLVRAAIEAAEAVMEVEKLPLT